MMKTQTPAKSVKLMVRQVDYEYLSTIAVLNGVSIPAALSQVLRGVRENGLTIVLVPKTIAEKPVPDVKLVKGKVVRTAQETEAMAAYSAQPVAFGAPYEETPIGLLEGKSADERFAIAVAWHTKNPAPLTMPPVVKVHTPLSRVHERHEEYINTVLVTKALLDAFMSRDSTTQWNTVDNYFNPGEDDGDGPTALDLLDFENI